jgi:hypothetical protein
MTNRLIAYGVCFVILSACATPQMPVEHHEHHSFPATRVYVEEPTGRAEGWPYKVMGWVRSKASFPTMEQAVNDPNLCTSYYNKAAKMLLKEAAKVKADAVIKVRSIVFMIDGKAEEHIGPECSDDGAEGEVLLRGIAIKFLPKKKLQATPTPVPMPTPEPGATPDFTSPDEPVAPKERILPVTPAIAPGPGA